MKNNWISRIIAGVLTLTLVVNLSPTVILATEALGAEGSEDVSNVELILPDASLGVQHGLSVDTTTSQVMPQNAYVKDLPSTHSLDMYEELRYAFGLTDLQIEQGVELHGSELVFTNQLSNLNMYAEALDLSSEQLQIMARLIASGYKNEQAFRAIIAKDVFGLTLEQIMQAKVLETKVNTDNSLDAEISGARYSSGQFGLPYALVESTLRNDSRSIDEIEQEMAQAYNEAYFPDEAVSLFASEDTQQKQYLPEIALGTPYSYDRQGNFNVNVNTGAYSYSETDLAIPGKNGLDLILTRQYHSDRANSVKSVGYYLPGRGHDAIKVHYRWICAQGEDENGVFIFYRELATHSMYTIDDIDDRNLAFSEYIYPIDGYMDAVQMKNAMMKAAHKVTARSNISGAVEDVYLVADIVDYGPAFGSLAKNESFEDTYYIDEFGLGNGWMLGLSHLRQVDFSADDMDPRDNHLQLILSDGTQYNIKASINTSSNGIENYYGDDLIFRRCQSGEYPNAVYGLYYKDGRVEYFNSDRRNIAICDRFGNAITIAYDVDDATKQVNAINITDTLGNLVEYKKVALNDEEIYNIESRRYTSLWQLSLNGNVIRKYYSNRQTVRIYEDPDDRRSEILGYMYPTVLVAVSNENGEITKYNSDPEEVRYNSFVHPVSRPTPQETQCAFVSSASDGYDVLVPMNSVTYPNGGISKVNTNCNAIESIGYNGYRHYIRCESVTPMSSAEASTNTPTTVYSYGDFDGLEGKAPYAGGHYYTSALYQQSHPLWNTNEETKAKTINQKNYDLTYTFNQHGQSISIKKRSYSDFPLRWSGDINENDLLSSQTSWEAQETTYTYEADECNWPTSICAIYRDATSGSRMTATEYYTYDSKGNVKSYTKPDGQVEYYTYDAKYSLPLTVSYHQNADTYIQLTNTPSSDGKSIQESQITNNGTLVSKTAYRYNEFGQLIERDDYLSESSYVTTAYDYGGGALPVQVAVSRVATASGALAAATPGFPSGTVARRQTYNDRGWIMSETDANGNTTSYAYDAAGRLTGATQPNGTSLSYSYDVAKSTVTYTDEAGSQWICTYGKSGKLQKVAEADTGKVLQLNTYDRNDQLVKQVIYGEDTPDQTTYYRYDTDGRLVERENVDENGTTIYQESYKYENGAGKVTKTVTGDSAAPSVVTTTYQDNMGNTVRTGIFRNNNEEITKYSYDYLGNQTQVMTAYTQAQTGKPGPTVTNTYDYAGRVLTTSDAEGYTAVKTYDWLGNQLTDVAPQNNTTNDKTKYQTSYTYDALGRLLRVETPLASGHTGRTDYTYDPNGNVTQEKIYTGAKGDTTSARTTSYTYDALNRLTQVQAGGSTTRYSYDVLGNIISMSVGGVQTPHVTTYAYDEYSNLLTQTDAMGKELNYTYDINGLLTSKTDRRQITTNYTYDAMGRLTRSQAGTDYLAFTYTVTGQRKSATSNGQTTTYTYNDAGDLLKEKLPYATKSMTYGAGGLRASFTVTDGSTTYLDNEYKYDKAGHLTEVKGLNGSQAHYTYDKNGSVKNVSNGNNTTAAYSYNKANMVTEVKNKHDKLSLSNFKYTYGADGNQLTKTDVVSGATTSYTYDDQGRLTQENMTGANAFTNTYSYDAYGNRTQAVLDGVAVNYTYDANNRLLSTTGGAEASYTYDAQGNLIKREQDWGDLGTASFTYTYDNFNRLKEVRDKSARTVYTYDADGLRTSKTASGHGTERYVYDNGQLVLTLVPKPEALYSGVLPELGEADTSFGLEYSQTYYVDVDGVIYQATAQIGEEEIAPIAVPMDGPDDGRPEVPVVPPDPSEPPAHLAAMVVLRVRDDVVITNTDGADSGTIEAPAGTTVKVYSEDPRLTTTAYVRGLNLIAAQADGNTTYYHYNAHGDVVQTTDTTGAVTHDYLYDAFGVEKNADEADTNPFRYCGEQFDAETGDYYLRARYYSPGVGSFTQEDPAMDGLNWYAYCAGNPVAFVDPSGLVEVGLRAYAATYPRSVVQWDAETGVASVTYKGKTLQVPGTSDNTRDGRIYVDDSLFVDLFGTECKYLVYQDEITGNISIRTGFKYSSYGYGNKLLFEGTEDTPGITYAQAFFDGIEQYWSGEFGGYHVSTYAGYVDWGVKVNFSNQLDVSKVVSYRWGRDNPGVVSMYRGDSRDGVAYTLDAYKWVAAHEFGHVLGVGDAYDSENSREVISIYNKFWTPVQSGDIALVLDAWSQSSFIDWP